jgi:hypothetical protein
MNAIEYVQHLYDTHQPDRHGICAGEHDVTGHEYDLPDWRYISNVCSFHSAAAKILGLPVIEWVDTRPVREGPALPLPMIVQAAYDRAIRQSLSTVSLIHTGPFAAHRTLTYKIGNPDATL